MPTLGGVLILLPPSEGKAAPLRGKPLDLAALGFPSLHEARASVLSDLVDLCSTGQDQGQDPLLVVRDGDVELAAKVLGIGGTQLALVHANATLTTASTARADRVYTGVLYDALGFATLGTAAKRRASTRVAITSSLFGLVRPGDPIAAYRLSGDVTLPGVGPVAAVWRQHLGPAVLEALGNGLLVDLRSTMYAGFWRPPAEMAHRVATVRVLHEHNGTLKVVSHFNKATKGRIVRALLEDGGNPSTPARLAALLRDLGWAVEVGEPSRRGTQLDVVVAEI